MKKINRSSLPRSSITVSGVSAETLEEQIEYVKESLTSFSLLLSDVKGPRDTANSYDILWVMPGYGTTSPVSGQDVLLADGVLCDLRHTVYKFENVSAYTLNLRLQRPMGFKTDPSALGMWEPAVHGKDSLLIPVKPHSTKVLTFSNASTSLMCPRLEMRKGRACVHLASFCVTKEPISDFGNASSSKDQDAFMVTVVTTYRANDGVVGRVGNYNVVSFTGSQRLDEINSGPPPPIRLADLRVKGGNVEMASITLGTKNVFALDFTTVSGAQVKDVDGLDKSTIYEIPYNIPGKAPGDKVNRFARYIRWNADDPAYDLNAWVVCDLHWEYTSKRNRYRYIAGNKDEWPNAIYASDGLTMPSSTVLKPVYASEFAVKGILRNNPRKVKVRVRAAVRYARVYHDLADVEDGILDTLLTAIVIIVKVVKVGVEIAGMVGMLAINPPSVGTQLCTSGQDA